MPYNDLHKEKNIRVVTNYLTEEFIGNSNAAFVIIKHLQSSEDKQILYSPV